MIKKGKKAVEILTKKYSIKWIPLPVKKIVRLFRRRREVFLTYFIKTFNSFLATIIQYMATTGLGTNKCLEKGALPVSIHYYQPIPDIGELEKRQAWDKISQLNGIDFKPRIYIDHLKKLSQKYADECKWPNERTDNPKQFYLNNACFSYGCAAPLHSLIRDLKPKKIIEIGSGNSTRVIASAIEYNHLEKHECRYIIIDPYSSIEICDLPLNSQIIKKPVELVELQIFESLTENDILFIDSSHVSKIGSDVNFEILEILPRLRKGVYIHFHDIPMPYEYNKVYFTKPSFRVFWTESYLLQAFLIGNRSFEIYLPMAYLQTHYLNELADMFPHSKEACFGWVSGSFWIKKVVAESLFGNSIIDYLLPSSQA